MNRRISYLAIAAGIVVISLCPATFAKQGKPGSEMKLVSIDVPNNKITVSDPNGNITTVAVMQVTTVTVNGQPAQIVGFAPRHARHPFGKPWRQDR